MSNKSPEETPIPLTIEPCPNKSEFIEAVLRKRKKKKKAKK